MIGWLSRMRNYSHYYYLSGKEFVYRPVMPTQHRETKTKRRWQKHGRDNTEGENTRYGKAKSETIKQISDKRIERIRE